MTGPRHGEQAHRNAVRLVLVGGPPGVGKTTLAYLLAERLDAAVLSSDRVRKELAGLAPDRPAPAPLGEGLYTDAWNQRVVQELLERSRAFLEDGRTVLIDRTWSRQADRDRARQLAEGTGAHLVELCCWAPEAVVETRVRDRDRQQGGAGPTHSDADAELAKVLRARFEPWPTALIVDTTRPPEEAVQLAQDYLRAS